MVASPSNNPNSKGITPVFTTLSSMLHNDDGATLVEYSLVVALIAVAAIGAMTVLGGKVSALFTSMSGQLNAA